VNLADNLPVMSVGKVHAGAVDVLDGRARIFECRGNDAEALLGLLSDVAVIRSDRARAGNVDVIADANCAGEANDGLVRGCAGDVGAGHEENCRLYWNCLSCEGCSRKWGETKNVSPHSRCEDELQTFLHQEENQVFHAAGIAPLIVIPADHFTGIAYDLGELGIEDAGERIAFEV